MNTLKELDKYFKVIRDLDTPKHTKLISIGTDGYMIEEYNEELYDYVEQELVLCSKRDA